MVGVTWAYDKCLLADSHFVTFTHAAVHLTCDDKQQTPFTWNSQISIGIGRTYCEFGREFRMLW